MKKIENIIGLIIVVALVFGLFHVPPDLTDLVINALIGLIVSLIFSLTAASLVEGVTGDLLKTIAFNIKIFGLKFSVTVFAIVTFLVEKWLFGF